MRPPRIVRIALSLVGLAKIFALSSRRREWSQEWAGEVIGWWRTNGDRPWAAVVLLRRALLSPLDALALRRSSRRAEPQHQKSRTQRKEVVMESFLEDSKFALRSFGKRPALTAVLLLTMAIGIGGNTAIFSLLEGIVLAPLPFADSDRLVAVWPARSGGLSKKVFERLQQESTSYAALSAWSEDAVKLRGAERAEMVFGPRVTAQFFDVLGARPALGRLFIEGDDRRGPRHVVLSHEFWQKHYGGDASIIGRTETLNEEIFEVVGVLEESFALAGILVSGYSAGLEGFDLVVPHLVEKTETDYDANYLDIMGRLRPGVSTEQANAELRILSLKWAREAGITEEWAESASVVSLQDHLVGDVRPTLLLLQGAVAFILLIVVANIANLLLARILAREQEISVRAALGASWSRLVRQLLTESTLLALLGGALGIGLASLSLRALIYLLPGGLPRMETIGLVPEVLAFSLVLAVGTGIAVGLVPALTVVRSGLMGSTSRGSRGQTLSRSRRRLRSTLVVIEVTLAVVLMTGAGVLVKSFWKTLQVDPGFEPRGLVRASVLPGPTEFPSPMALDEYFQHLRERVEGLPGVQEAALVHAVPVVNGGWVMGTFPSDDPPTDGDLPPFARWRPVSPEYFAAAGLQLRAGRLFTDEDRLEAEPVVILNTSIAERFFGSVEGAVGQDMRITFEEPRRLRVVGVVENVQILGLREEAPIATYRPFAQASAALHRIGVHHRSLMLRTDLPLRRLDPMLRSALAEHDPFANVLQLQSMEAAIAASLSLPRIVMLLLAVFAGIALLLGAVGLYGVMGYTVGERTREMGIRLALGAPMSSVLGIVLARGLALTGIGLGLGMVLALALTRFLGSHLFEVSPTDPETLLFASLALLLAGLVATFLPARRASRIDPVVALRAE